VGVTSLTNNLAYYGMTTVAAGKKFNSTGPSLLLEKSLEYFLSVKVVISSQNFKGFSGDFFHKMTMT
jgi:hypothetical protein